MPPNVVTAVDISQFQIILALNEYLAHSRDLIESLSQVDINGICHGLSIASVVKDNFEEELCDFLQATPEERHTLGTKAWNFGRWLADFIPVFQDLEKPYVGKKGTRISQLGVFPYAELKVTNKYTICLTRDKLAESFALLGAEPCTMLFLYNNHTIRVKYENGQFSVYDPNNKAGTVIYDNYHEAANDISEIFVAINKNALPNELKANYKYNVHITVVKKESDNSTLVPTPFLERLGRINNPSYDEQTTDAIRTTGLFHAISRGDNRNLSAFLTKNYLESIDKLNDLEAFIRKAPLDIIKELLNDNEFRLNLKKLTYDKSLDIEEMLRSYNPLPELKLVATAFFLLIKRDNRTLEDIILTDYHTFGDPTLVALMGIEFLKNVAATSNDLAIKKLAINMEMSTLAEDIYKSTIESLDISKAQTILFSFYYHNLLENAEDYALSRVNDMRFVEQIRPSIDTLINLSVYDDRTEWFDFCLNFLAKPTEPQIKNWLSMAMKYECKKIFKHLADKMDADDLLFLQPILSASHNGSPEFLDFLIDYFKSRKILLNFSNQFNNMGENALHLAAFKGKKKHVMALLETAPPIEIMSFRNETPLYIACARGHSEIAEILFNKHENHYFLMPNGRSIFEAAANSINPNMLSCIINLFLTRYTIEKICSKIPCHIIMNYFIDHIAKNNPLQLTEMINTLMSLYPLDELLIFNSFNHYFNLQLLNFSDESNQSVGMAPEPLFESNTFQRKSSLDNDFKENTPESLQGAEKSFIAQPVAGLGDIENNPAGVLKRKYVHLDRRQLENKSSFKFIKTGLTEKSHSPPSGFVNNLENKTCVNTADITCPLPEPTHCVSSHA